MESVKSPMYATSVGLVLSGFRALDERENRYNDAKVGKNVKVTSVKKEFKSGDFFSKILNKTKGLLIDDQLGSDY